ncbi:MAG: hypothetical protein GY853_14000 [PVC group bacterium]|nr:hypothetical protein [PVC group bacterium]
MKIQHYAGLMAAALLSGNSKKYYYCGNNYNSKKFDAQEIAKARKALRIKKRQK